MDGPSLSHCMVDEKSARRCFSRFFDNFECRSRNSIGCADNPNPVAQVFRHYDLRMSKLFKVGTTRTSVNFDFYNVLNSNSVINENITYGATWRTPQLILLPRIFKLSAQFDF